MFRCGHRDCDKTTSKLTKGWVEAEVRNGITDALRKVVACPEHSGLLLEELSHLKTK